MVSFSDTFFEFTFLVLLVLINNSNKFLPSKCEICKFWKEFRDVFVTVKFCLSLYVEWILWVNLTIRFSERNFLPTGNELLEDYIRNAETGISGRR